MPSVVIFPIQKVLAAVLTIALPIASLSGCRPVTFEDTWMDAEGTEDPAVSDPTFLVSQRILAPTPDDLDTPVVIAVHGFGASTYEWMDFKEYAEARGVLVSSVLLGGHGRSLSVWTRTGWDDWARPIIEEYAALRSLGYTNIVFAAASAGGTLVAQLIQSGAIDAFGPPQGAVFIAPLLIPVNKLLYQTRWIGVFFNNIDSGQNDVEKELFYFNRPHNVFYPLLDLVEKTEADLEVGIDLPEGMPLHIFQAKGDSAVDLAGLALWRAGLSPESQVDITEFDSDLHVITRELGRESWSERDEEIQLVVFDRILEMANANAR